MILAFAFVLAFVGQCFKLEGQSVLVGASGLKFLLSNSKLVKKSIKLHNYDENNFLNFTNKKNKGKRMKTLDLPNTALIDNNLRNRPALSIDFNNGRVSASFNFNNRFELFGPLSFQSYSELSAKIANLVNYVCLKEACDNPLILVGVPFNYESPTAYAKLFSFSNENSRLLFQILRILDFSSYLSHFLNPQNTPPNNFNNHYNSNYGNNCGSNDTDNCRVNFEKSAQEREDPKTLVETHCLYCSLLNNCSNNNCNISNFGNNNNFSNIGNNNKNNFNIGNNNNCDNNKDKKREICRLDGRTSCANRFDLNAIRFPVIAVSEQLSSFQVNSLFSNNNLNNFNNCKEGLENNNLNNGNFKEKGLSGGFDRDGLSTLNIYLNFLHSNFSNNNNYNHNHNKDNNLSNINEDIEDNNNNLNTNLNDDKENNNLNDDKENNNLNNDKEKNVLVLPNCGGAFDRAKSLNLLLLTQIRSILP